MPSPTMPPRGHHRLGALARFFASGSALAAAAAGIPYVLIVTIGTPWPEQVTSLGDLLTRLTQPVSDPFVLKVLALLGWACWVYFMATLVRETVWLLARLPALLTDTTLLRRRTVTLPAHRAAAALLVGTLLLALVGMWRLPTAHAAAPLQASAAPQPVAAAPQHVPPAQASETGHSTYIVQPGDTLWDIAARNLGDPLKWPQIYQLSCTIRQSDGRLLADPDLILPGWRLHLPAATREPKRSQSPQIASSPGPPPSHPSAPAPEPERPQPANPGEHNHERPDTREQRGHQQAPKQRPVTIPVGTASAIGVTTAAGIAAAIGFARWHATRRRTPRLEALAAPLEADDELLGEALHRSNQAHLAARAARHHNLEAMPRRTAPADPGQPGTVTIAEKTGREVRIDALARPGGIQLTGPGAEGTVRHLVIAIAAAAQRLRPAPPSVHLIITQATLRRLLPPAPEDMSAWMVTDTATTALEAAEHALLEHARHEQHLDAASSEGCMPALHILLLDQPAGDPSRLARLAQQATPGQLAVITLGDGTTPAQHPLIVAADGTASSTLTALHGATLFLLAPDAATEILGTLHAAHGLPRTPADSSDEPEDPDPAHTPQQTSPRIPSAAPPAVPDGGARARMVHIRLFGGFKLFVHQKECALADTRKEETREFVALLAAHPDGLRAEEIIEKMQLSDDPDEAKAELENLRRAARRVFRGATGKKEVAFVLLSGQVHRLDPQYISTDVAAFTGILKQVTTADSPYARAAVLQRATDTYTGLLCDGADYLWVHGLRTELHRRAMDALMLLAEHTGKHSADPEPALALLNQAADLDPTNERVYRRIIQLQLALGRDDAAHRTLALLTERLTHIDATPEPATLALLHARPTPPAKQRPAGQAPTRGAAARH